jgi:Protein of unknown function (DUF3486)
LPVELRDELTAKIIGNAFGDYAGLSAWLEEKGCSISRSALHRFGSDLESEFNEAMQDARRSIELAKAMKASGNSDDDGVLLDASSSILQDQLLRISMALRTVEVDPQEAVKLVSQAARALADLGRMKVSYEKWQREESEKIRIEERAKAEERATSAAKAAGASPGVIEKMREVFGIEL